MKRSLKKLKLRQNKFAICSNSQSFKHVRKDPSFNSQSKHITVRYHLVLYVLYEKKISWRKFIRITMVPTYLQRASMMFVAQTLGWAWCPLLIDCVTCMVLPMAWKGRIVVVIPHQVDWSLGRVYLKNLKSEDFAASITALWNYVLHGYVVRWLKIKIFL